MSRDMDARDGWTEQVFAAVIVHDQVLAHGRANSSKTAKIMASREALKLIEGLSPQQYRQRFKCDCVFEEFEAEQVEAGAMGTAV